MDDNPADFYTYKPLMEPDSIRLLIIQPATSIEDEIHGVITHTRLSLSSVSTNGGNAGFTALSYVWGDMSNLQYISVGNKRLSIGANLHDALRHLRGRDSQTRLWTDAICINQTDVNERNHQVQQMRAIYATAATTIVYLGSQTLSNTGQSAWNFLERNSDWLLRSDPNLHAQRMHQIDFRGGLEDVEIDVLTRPWFRRVWVLQEIMVSNIVFVQCGKIKISWDDLCKVVLLEQRLNDRYGFSLVNRELHEVVQNMFQARCAFQHSCGHEHFLPSWYQSIKDSRAWSTSILEMLARARRLEATDSRDKLYALFGISSGIDLEHEMLVIDYRKSVEKTYSDFSRYMIDSTGSYDVLSFIVSHQPPSFLVPAVSTPWWLDWRLAAPSRTIISTFPHESAKDKSKRLKQVQDNHRWLMGGKYLQCHGKVIGIVTEVGNSIMLKGQEELILQRIRDQRQNNRKKMSQEILYQWRRNWLGFGPRHPTPIPPFEVPVKPHSVEEHLIRRSRKSVTWTSDQSLAVAQVSDRDSIVDNKSFVIYSTRPQELDEGLGVFGLELGTTLHAQMRRKSFVKRFTKRGFGSHEGLALAPTFAKKDDFIIHLKGGHVAFLVRPEAPPESADHDHWAHPPDQPSSFGQMWCKIVGECVVNKHEQYDTLEDDAANIDDVFVFLD